MTTWTATTQDDRLVDKTSEIESTNSASASDLQLDGNEYQALRGFGGCFNELGWLPLQTVTEEERDQIIKGLFSPDEILPTTGTATTRPTAITRWSISPSSMMKRL